MKTTTTLAVILFPFFLLSQQTSNLETTPCFADAGGPFHQCPFDTLGILIGGSPSVVGGTPPFTYEWSMTPYEMLPGNPNWTFYASDYLDDTSAANPQIVSSNGINGDTLVFRLKVTDGLGCISNDSCVVVFTQFMITLQFYTFNITEGDSVFLDQGRNVHGGNGNIACEWKPGHGLSNVTVCDSFWAKPTHTTNYFVTITDEFGCSEKGGTFYSINVNPMNTSDYKVEAPFEVFPNPVKGKLAIKTVENFPIDRLELIDLNGKKIEIWEKPTTEIDLRHLPSGFYFLSIESRDRFFYHKLVKE